MLNHSVVIAGLDPAIALSKRMDARVKPAHDEEAFQISGTFEWVVVRSAYIIVYEIDDELGQVEIVAVLHGAQRKTR